MWTVKLLNSLRRSSSSSPQTPLVPNSDTSGEPADSAHPPTCSTSSDDLWNQHQRQQGYNIKAFWVREVQHQKQDQGQNLALILARV